MPYKLIEWRKTRHTRPLHEILDREEKDGWKAVDMSTAIDTISSIVYYSVLLHKD